MKILAFVDLHGSKKAFEHIKQKAKHADLIWCLGDLTFFQTDIEQWIKKLDSLKKEVWILDGNHEEESILRKLAKRSKHIKYVHKKAIILGDYAFVCYGGMGFSLREREFEKFAKSVSKKIKGKRIVLLTHAPPYGRIDMVGRHHVGNKSLTDFIKKYKVAISVFGHIHEWSYRKAKLGKTIVANPGPAGRIIKLKYEIPKTHK